MLLKILIASGHLHIKARGTCLSLAGAIKSVEAKGGKGIRKSKERQ